MTIIMLLMKAKKILFAAGIAAFMAYFFCAARPIPLETILVPLWVNSLESGTPVILDSASNNGGLLPFSLGGRFGYISPDGDLSVNHLKKANVSLSEDRWAEYEAEPERITINGADGETLVVIENPRGYPFFLDGRTFLINSEQNAISEIGNDGEISWTYEFAGPITCVDCAAGLVLAGTLEGVACVLDGSGKQIFSFEPGGSRYSVIAGCAISRDGLRLGIISGIDDQRFLLLEKFGASPSDYKVIYHEFLDDGFRRPVHISFIEDDRCIAFECCGGMGFYDISSRQIGRVELNGELCAFDQSGGNGLVFAIVSYSEDLKKLVGVRLPGTVIMEAPFRSDEVFLGRMDSRLVMGGGQTLISFDLEKR